MNDWIKKKATERFLGDWIEGNWIDGDWGKGEELKVTPRLLILLIII